MANADAVVGMLFARVRILAPQAHSVLLAPLHAEEADRDLARIFCQTTREHGLEARLIDLVGLGPAVERTGSPSARDFSGPEEARTFLQQFAGISVIRGRGLLDDPATLFAAAAADATVLLVTRSQTSRSDLAQARLELERSQATLVGTVLLG
jgi:hypothetical protein